MSSTPTCDAPIATVLFPTLFSMGLMADLQYCDCDDGFSHVEKYPRRYRQSLETLRQAVASFELHNTQLNVLLGDQIDCKCRGSAQETLARVLALTNPNPNPSPSPSPSFTAVQAEWHMCAGNHDLSALSREAVLQAYVPPSVREASPAASGDPNPNPAPPSAAALYYAVAPAPGFRFLFLDPFDVSEINASSPANALLAEQTLLRYVQPC